MKAKEILEKYNISRQTLCAWVKSGKVVATRLPGGQYDYSDELDAEHMVATVPVPETIGVVTTYEDRLYEAVNKKLAISDKLFDEITKFFKTAALARLVGVDTYEAVAQMAAEYKAITLPQK